VKKNALDCNYFPGKKLLNRLPYDGQLNHRPELQQMPKSNNYLGLPEVTKTGWGRVLLILFFFSVLLAMGMGATSSVESPFVFVGVNLLFKPHYLCGCSAITRLQKRHDSSSTWSRVPPSPSQLQPATAQQQQQQHCSNSNIKSKSTAATGKAKATAAAAAGCTTFKGLLTALKKARPSPVQKATVGSWQE